MSAKEIAPIDLSLSSLLELLDKPEIREKILEISSNPKKLSATGGRRQDRQDRQRSAQVVEDTVVQNLKAELENAKNENDEMKKLISKLKETICGKDEQITEIGARLGQETERLQQADDLAQTRAAKLEAVTQELAEVRSQLDHANQELKGYTESFEAELRLKSLYDGLSQDTQSSLKGVFKDDSVQGLIACGVQERNISNLWEYIKGEVVNGSNSDIESLIEIYDSLFARFTLAYPVFQLQEEGEGAQFDPTIHIKHNSSQNASGSILRVLLKGYVNKKTRKVVKSSVVVL